MSEWISVEDRLPEGKVLMCFYESCFGSYSKEIEAGYYDNPEDYEDGVGGGWRFWLSDKPVVGKGVTHWMPLPELPK